MIPLFPKQEDFFTLFKRQSAMVRQGCSMLHDMMENFDHLEDRGQTQGSRAQRRPRDP